MILPITKSTTHSWDPLTLYAPLCPKQLKIRQVPKEIEALNRRFSCSLTTKLSSPNLLSVVRDRRRDPGHCGVLQGGIRDRRLSLQR